MNSLPTSGLLNQASAAERRADWRSAVDLYERAYAAACAAHDTAGLLESVVRQAHCRLYLGDIEPARDSLVLAAAMCQEDPGLRQLGRVLNNMAIVEQRCGRMDRAEAMYLRARDAARADGNERVLGEVEQNLGVIANIRGEAEQALRHYLAGLQHLERAGYRRGEVCALNNLGMLHVDLGNLDVADGYFTRALGLAESLGDTVSAGTIQVNRTELYLALGDRERARETCDEGFEIACRLGDDTRRAEALKFYGIIYRETGRPHLAEIHLREAVAIAEAGEPLLEAECQRELARVFQGLGRNRDALGALNRSHALFTAVQARSDQQELRRRMGELEAEFLELVQMWGESIEAKDRYTSGHCSRVAEYACRIAAAAGMGDQDLVWFRMGAFLHDIGKVEVSAEILNKPGRLSPEERAAMERHPVIGDELLATVEFPWDIRPMVRWHHERWDGRGYPDRLSGEEVHLTARILRIADVFDALTTARSYRDPMSPEDALAEMTRDDGSFDPALFAVFRDLYPEFAEMARAACSEMGVEETPIAVTAEVDGEAGESERPVTRSRRVAGRVRPR